MAQKKNKSRRRSKKKKDTSYVAGPGRVDIRLPKVPTGKPRKAARRDVALFNHPLLREIDEQMTDVRDQYGELDEAAQNIYQGFQGELAGLPGVGKQYDAITDDLTGQIANLGQALGDFGVGPQHEFQANADLFGSIGSGALAALAGAKARSQDWTRGVKAQGAVDWSNRRANYQESMADELDALRAQRLDVHEQMPEQLKQRLTELRDQRFQQGLGLWDAGLQAQQMTSDDSLRAALINMLGKQAKKKPKKGGKRRGDGGGGGGGHSHAPANQYTSPSSGQTFLVDPKDTGRSRRRTRAAAGWGR